MRIIIITLLESVFLCIDTIEYITVQGSPASFPNIPGFILIEVVREQELLAALSFGGPPTEMLNLENFCTQIKK